MSGLLSRLFERSSRESIGPRACSAEGGTHLKHEHLADYDSEPEAEDERFWLDEHGQDIEQQEEEEDDDEDDDYEEDDMDFIGRFTFRPLIERPRFMSLEHYYWLIQQYFAPHGEPGGVIAATEPETLPPVDGVVVKPQESAVNLDGSEPSTSYSGAAQASTSQSEGNNLDPEASAQGSGDSDAKHAKHIKSSSNATLSSVRSILETNHLLTEEELRHKIGEIQRLQLPDRERDLLVQRLMTANHYRIRGLDLAGGGGEEDQTPGIAVDGSSGDSGGETASKDNITRMNISEADRKPTYTETGELGCSHYQRNCKLECSQCLKWYTCRMCHDTQEESHKLIRQETKHMLCMKCGTAQSAASDCVTCGRVMARYYCSICKLWDNDPLKHIYHCNDCGICRIGNGLGKDFFHCQRCNVCMSIELENSHRCIEHSTECDCPICGEFMFTSTETVVFMKCGHSIHQGCFEQHTKSSYKCPTCTRSIMNMETRFRILDAEIRHTPLPEPYNRWRSTVVCNDCQAKSNVDFHFLGLRCPTCLSYNTAQIQLIRPEDDNELSHEEQQELVDVLESRVAEMSLVNANEDEAHVMQN